MKNQKTLKQTIFSIAISTLAGLMVTLVGDTLFASAHIHTGDVKTNYGIRLGHYRMISVTGSPKLKLSGLACNLSKLSVTIPNSVRNEYGNYVASDVVSMDNCYPGSSAVMSVTRSLTLPNTYSFMVSVLNSIPNSRLFVNYANETQLVEGGDCTINGNRLTCSLSDGGEIVLDLL